MEGLPRLPPMERQQSLSDKVAELLLETIVERGLRPGDRLPSERELGEQLAVSRTVVREAVRSLVAKGLVEVRTGSGLRVAAVDSSVVTESMRLYLHGQGGAIDYPKVHEVRAMIEVHVAGLAADRAREDDLVRLAAICDHMEEILRGDDVDALARVDVQFHRAVAQSTQNPLYGIMLNSIGDTLLRIRRETIGVTPLAERALASHREIHQCIAARDPEGARSAMQEHLNFTLESWKELQPTEPGAPPTAVRGA